MEMEAMELRARVALLEAGLLAVMRMHPVPEAARADLDDGIDDALAEIGPSAAELQPEHAAAMSRVIRRAGDLLAALE